MTAPPVTVGARGSSPSVMHSSDHASAAPARSEARLAALGRAQDALQRVALGTATATSGEEFFRSLVEHLASALGARDAFVGLLRPGAPASVGALSMWSEGASIQASDYTLDGTPCARIIESGPCYFDDVQRSFPHDVFLAEVGVVSYVGSPIRDAAGRPLGIVSALHDRPLDDPESALTILSIFAARAGAELERARSEAALRESESRHRLLFARNPLPMLLYDVETLAILEVNDATVGHYGYSRAEWLAMSLTDIRPPEEIPELLASRAVPGSGPHRVGPHRHRRKDGSLITVEVVSDDARVGERAARLVLVHDITERHALEAQLRQSQKMEAVGQLAGGVAHDFNNLLTVIRVHAELLLESIGPESPQHDDIESIQRAAGRASSLTRQLRAVSRKQLLQPRVLDLNIVLGGLEPMLRRLICEDIRLVARTSPSLGRVSADSGQIEQVLVNLAVNARDAMPRGGTLTIETSDVELDADFGRRRGVAMTGGPYVRLAVSDTGTGMDEATRSRVFEPFFTTMEVGRGTGLGLSTVYGIVKQSNGYVWVSSEPDRGTTFEIYLPRIADAVPDERTATSPPAAPGSETILLVEDEDAVRSLARRILERQGYTVLEARHGRDALRIAKGHDGALDLVITDVVMPEMSGSELARRLAAQRPGVPLLYMSGYTDDEIIRRGVLDPGMAFLEKPFTSGSLVRKVREILDAVEA